MAQDFTITIGEEGVVIDYFSLSAWLVSKTYSLMILVLDSSTIYKKEIKQMQTKIEEKKKRINRIKLKKKKLNLIADLNSYSLQVVPFKIIFTIGRSNLY